MKTGLQTYNVYTIANFNGETVPLSVTSVSSSVAFYLPASAKNNEVLVTNSGTVTAFINFGLASAGSVTAQLPGTNGTTGATPILGGAIYTFQKQSDNQQADTCAAICSGSGTTVLYFTSCQGS